MGTCDDGDVAGDAAVVVPVGLEGGDAVGEAGAVDEDDEAVVTGFGGGGDVAVEGGEASLVLTDEMAVDPCLGAVVGCADVEEGVGVGLRGEGDVALVPERAFVEEEVGALGVPVAGDLDGGAFGEVVLDEVVVGGLVVEVVAAEAVGVGVGEDVPVAVEGDGGAVVGGDEEGGGGGGLG